MKASWKIILICLALPALTLAAKSKVPTKIEPPAVKEPRIHAKKSSEKEQLAEPVANPRAQKEFQRGYAAYSNGNYQKACRHLFSYLSLQTPDDTDYEWAEFFFGISLKKLGFSHAAVDTLAHLVTRKPNQKIVNYCLELFEQVLDTTPLEREVLINRVLCDQEYGFLDGTVADFVHYHQGVYDWEHGFFDWGNQHFSQITAESNYYYKYIYKKALLALYRDEIDEAVSILKQILRSDKSSIFLKDEARKTLARLLYEKDQFEEADFMYDQIKKSILAQAENLLERAWAQYRMGNLQKAMGLLYSFEAPSFRDAFKPEYYILKSFIYKDVCHYKRAMAVMDDFKGRYGDSLEIIYRRNAPVDNHALMFYLLNKKHINETWRFLDLIEKEKAACAQIKDKALKAHLEKLYDLQLEQSRNKLKVQIEEEYEKAADSLLQYEESSHLMEYEIGLDMYKRVYQYHYQEDKKDGPDKPKRDVVVYPFQGEFWNDELADYKVTLPNKCQDMEEWDIFFK